MLLFPWISSPRCLPRHRLQLRKTSRHLNVPPRLGILHQSLILLRMVSAIPTWSLPLPSHQARGCSPGCSADFGWTNVLSHYCNQKDEFFDATYNDPLFLGTVWECLLTATNRKNKNRCRAAPAIGLTENLQPNEPKVLNMDFLLQRRERISICGLNAQNVFGLSWCPLFSWRQRGY